MDSMPIHSIIIVEEKSLQGVSVEEQGKAIITILHPLPNANLVINAKGGEEKEKEDQCGNDALGPHIEGIKEVVKQRTDESQEPKEKVVVQALV